MWKHVLKAKGHRLYFKMLSVHLQSGRTNDSFPGLQTPCRVSAGNAVQQLMQNTRLQTSAHWWIHLNEESTRSTRQREKTGEEVRSHLSIQLISKGRYLTAQVRSSIPFHTHSFHTEICGLKHCPLFQIGALSASRNSTYNIPVTVLRHHQWFMYDYGVIMVCKAGK